MDVDLQIEAMFRSFCSLFYGLPQAISYIPRVDLPLLSSEDILSLKVAGKIGEDKDGLHANVDPNDRHPSSKDTS
jgi:hypothetical protein